MKKQTKLLNLLALLLGFVFITSCNSDDPEEPKPAPTIAFSIDEDSFTGYPGDEVEFTVNITAQGGFNTLYVKKSVDGTVATTAYDTKTRQSGVTPPTSETYQFTYTLKEEEIGKEVEFIFEVVDEASKTGTKKFTIITEEVPDTELEEEQDFTWQRQGGAAGTGLSTFGLKWTSNTATNAVITLEPTEGNKLVILTPNDYTTITTKEALKAKVDETASASQYTGVSVAASGTYNDVIATKVGELYYILNIKQGTVQVTGAGTNVTINGKYKK